MRVDRVGPLSAGAAEACALKQAGDRPAPQPHGNDARHGSTRSASLRDGRCGSAPGPGANASGRARRSGRGRRAPKRCASGWRRRSFPQLLAPWPRRTTSGVRRGAAARLSRRLEVRSRPPAMAPATGRPRHRSAASPPAPTARPCRTRSRRGSAGRHRDPAGRGRGRRACRTRPARAGWRRTRQGRRTRSAAAVKVNRKPKAAGGRVAPRGHLMEDAAGKAGARQVGVHLRHPEREVLGPGSGRRRFRSMATAWRRAAMRGPLPWGFSPAATYLPRKGTAERGDVERSRCAENSLWRAAGIVVDRTHGESEGLAGSIDRGSD